MADVRVVKGAQGAARLAMLAIAAGFADAAFASTGQTTVDADAKPYLIVGGLVATVAFFAWGAYFVPIGWRKLRLGEATREWPSTQGEITVSDIAEKKGYNEGEYTYYSPEIRYAYAVNDVSYVGQTVQAGMAAVHYLAKASVLATLSRYPVGARPRVLYDPADPAVSALEIGQVGAWRHIVSGAIGLVLAACAVWFVGWVILTPSG